ncbi:MAG: hypothetical protein J7L92_03065 [Dehalococcoidia bacterium]|nr:hypothetical protein [Dehalococcoidia bacterium]RLC64817.1 MAG: hypothetical protein DRI01_02720 [Chloroflexota bacterium]
MRISIYHLLEIKYLPCISFLIEAGIAVPLAISKMGLLGTPRCILPSNTSPNPDETATPRTRNAYAAINCLLTPSHQPLAVRAINFLNAEFHDEFLSLYAAKGSSE